MIAGTKIQIFEFFTAEAANYEIWIKILSFHYTMIKIKKWRQFSAKIWCTCTLKSITYSAVQNEYFHR